MQRSQQLRHILKEQSVPRRHTLLYERGFLFAGGSWMKRKRSGEMGIAKILGVALGLSGVILIIHTVPLYIWYAALIASLILLMFLLYNV